MLIKVRIIIASHLSDVQTGFLSPKDVNHRLNFCKYLLGVYPDTNQEIDADVVYEEFLSAQNKSTDVNG